MRKVDSNFSQKMRKSRNDYRSGIELLRNRVSLLAGRDKLLMTMYLENGNSFRQIARLAGVNDTIIARRIHRLTRQLLEGEYIICLQNRKEFTKDEMVIAKDYFLTGLSIKRIAGKRRCTYYRVRKTIERIQQVLETVKCGE